MEEEELLKLALEIKNCLKCSSPYEEKATRSAFVRDLYLEGPWFFPPRGQVRGFFGADNIMFFLPLPSLLF